MTIGLAEREPVLVDQALAHDAVDSLRERCNVLGATLHAYCLMPDHLHLLLQIGDHGLVDFVRDFRSRSNRVWSRHGGNGPLRQRNVHDRGIRTVRDVERAAAYMLTNLDRAELLEEWEGYPFLRGTIRDG